ncbi:MAG: spondin domain-containing protein [Balneola sp.]
MINSKILKSTLLSLLLVFGLVSCDDNDPEPAVEADFTVTIENVGESYSYVKSGSFSVPVGATEPSGIGPGGAFEFEFTAPLGSKLSLATMFVQSNDWFYATGSSGVDLYNSDGTQVTGDITSAFNLYDAGTEEDQEPGVGDNQVLRQSGPDTGPADDNNFVRSVDTSNLPSDEAVLQVTLTSTSSTGFMVRIENVSTATTLQTSEGGKPVPLSPGGWAVHAANQTNVFYEIGQPDYGEGLEGIAEDGTVGDIEATLEPETGITVPLSPGAYAVYTGSNPLFTANANFPNNGIEAVAEDGAPAELATALSANSNVNVSAAFAQPVGASSNGPLLPGSSYSFSFSAEEGDILNLATMFVQSNDLFYALGGDGIALFNNGTPISGDLTSSVTLWDAGTEANEEPGIGANQVIRQSGVDTGPADANTNVRLVNDSFTYPGTNEIIRVSIRLNQ